MIIIKGFKDRRGNRRDIIFKDISVYVIRMSFKDSVFLVCHSLDRIKYYIHMHYLSFWRFKKQVSKKLLYNMLDNKTASDLFKDNIAAIVVEDEDILIDHSYTVLRKQFIEL